MYKLTKLSIEEGKESLVWVGMSCKGDLFIVSEYATPNIPAVPEDIQVGDQILVSRNVRDWISTSAVKRIEKNMDNTRTIWTQTSVYKLEEVEAIAKE